jgi:hypothetical protein
MEKRYQVFISSTYRDLHVERQELIRALLELDCIPAGMELFPASDDDAWTLIKRVIDESDYYLVISAGRYGSQHPETGVGYTEMEYDYAISQNKPTIAFLHNDLSSLSVERSDTDPSDKEKLAGFREKMQKKVIKEWSSAEMLAGVASRSIVQLIKQKPGVGWIRADHAQDPRVEAEISQLRLKVAEQARELESAKVVSVAEKGATKAFTSIPGVNKALKYIGAKFGNEKAPDILFDVFRCLYEEKEGSSRSYLKLSLVAGRMAARVQIEPQVAEDILYSLSSEGAIDVDHDDDLVFNEKVVNAFREMRIQRSISGAH